MVECTSSEDRKLELILLGIVAGGFFTYLLARLIIELELLRLQTANNQYLYQPSASYSKKIIESPIKLISKNETSLYPIKLDKDGMIEHEI